MNAPMAFFLAALGGFLTFLLGKKGDKMSEPKPTTFQTQTVKQWEPILAAWNPPLRPIPLPFLLQWVAIESGGNPCAYGSANAKGPDGHPREQGIGQFYNPDDFSKLKIPSGSMRAYCQPGTQKQTRKLTADEISAQAKALIGLVQSCRDTAETALRKAGAQNWNGRDYWKMVKLVHGIPGLVKGGLAATSAKLGRAPRDWQEYKATLAAVKLDKGTEAYRNLFPKVLANAEKAVINLPVDTKGEV
jgi:hypothetical protein